MKPKMTLMLEDGVRHELEPGQIGIIKVALIQLKNYRDDGRKPSPELLDDIAGYEAIVNSRDPATRAEIYFDIKKENSWMRPREIARMAGWI